MPRTPSGGCGRRCAIADCGVTDFVGNTRSAISLSISPVLVVEADGGQHSDNVADRRRTAWLESEGWRVLRFWNNDALANTEGVVETILRELVSN